MSKAKVKGFTLVELVLVLVILSALLMVLMPALSNAINLPEQVARNEQLARTAHIVSQRLERVLSGSSVHRFDAACMVMQDDAHLCFADDYLVLLVASEERKLAKQIRGEFKLTKISAQHSALYVQFAVRAEDGAEQWFSQVYVVKTVGGNEA